MADDSSSLLQNVDYNGKLVLVYLQQVYNEKNTLINLKTIMESVGIAYITLKNKLKTLESLELVLSTKKNKEKVVVITEKGLNALQELEKSAEGKKIISDLKAELVKRKKQDIT